MAILSACAVGPDYVNSTPAALGIESGYVAPQPLAGAVDETVWWSRFDDPLLASLVAQSQGANLDIVSAVSRLAQARELEVQAGSARLPQIGTSRSVARSGFLSGRPTIALPGAGGVTNVASPDQTNFSSSSDASYTIDLFGGIARSVTAARADTAAAALDVEAVRLSVATNTASSYIQGRLAQERLAIAQDSLKIAEDNLEIAGWRVKAGLVSATDVEQARTQRAQRLAALPQLQTGIANAATQLAILTGRAPAATAQLFALPAPVPQPGHGFAVGIPADILRQRPDVAASERRLAAASERIGVATARLYPALSIGGSLGSSATSLSGLFDQLTFNLFGSVTQTLFDGGRLRSQVRQQRAATEGALADYKRNILSALGDVENALQAFWSADARAAAQSEALDAAQATAIYARSQYRAGLTDFTTLLTVENQLLAARDGLALARGDQALAAVQLYGALGGGFDASNANRATFSADNRKDPSP